MAFWNWLSRLARSHAGRSATRSRRVLGSGMVVRVNDDGGLTTIVSGLLFLTAMTFGPDGALYISNFGFGAPPIGLGQILRVDLGTDTGANAAGSDAATAAPASGPSVDLFQAARMLAETGAVPTPIALPPAAPLIRGPDTSASALVTNRVHGNTAAVDRPFSHSHGRSNADQWAMLMEALQGVSL